MDYSEFKDEHPKDEFEPTHKIWIPIDRAMVVLGPKKSDPPMKMSNLDAGLCPLCGAMLKETAPPMKRDFRIVSYVCTENGAHRYQRNELERTKPSQVQVEAWEGLGR